MKRFAAVVAASLVFVACNSSAAEPPCAPPKGPVSYYATLSPSPEPTCEETSRRYAGPARFDFQDGKLQVAGDIVAAEQQTAKDMCRTAVVMGMTDETVRVFLFSFDKAWTSGTGLVVIDGCRLPMKFVRKGTTI